MLNAWNRGSGVSMTRYNFTQGTHEKDHEWIVVLVVC